MRTARMPTPKSLLRAPVLRFLLSLFERIHEVVQRNIAGAPIAIRIKGSRVTIIRPARPRRS